SRHARLQDHAAHLPGHEWNLGMQVTTLVHVAPADTLVPGLPHHVDRRRCAAALEDGAIVGQMRLVCFTAVVEARRDVQREGHLAADAADHPHDAVLIRCDGAVDHRHEVGDFPNAFLGHETGDEDSRVGEVEL